MYLTKVIGASGNVGRLIALGLADKGACKVRAVARNAERAEEFFKGGVGDEVIFICASLCTAYIQSGDAISRKLSILLYRISSRQCISLTNTNALHSYFFSSKCPRSKWWKQILQIHRA